MPPIILSPYQTPTSGQHGSAKASPINNDLPSNQENLANAIASLKAKIENSTRKVSRLDRFSEFLQTVGCYEDDYIQQSMAELETK
jgi:hypothetical protein